ncbi:MAG: XdhC family protein [Sulfuricella sp.]
MMQSADVEVFRKCLEWREAGHEVMLATVVATWGSSPRPVGSLLAVRDDGLPAGSVSGGCIEADLIERVRLAPVVRPEVVSYGGSAEESRRFGLPCGGKLQLVLEHAPGKPLLQALLNMLNQRRLVGRRLELATGLASLYAPAADEMTHCDGHTLHVVHGPHWRLLLIGAGQVSQYLARMAQALDYQVLVCDPREEYRLAWDVPEAELLPAMPDDAVRALNPDARSAVIALAHDPRLDDLALLEALKSPAFYVGALGSQSNNARRRDRLRLFDLDAEAVARLHGPVGLPIGSRTPAEIAVAVLAELTALRHGIILRTASPAAREPTFARQAAVAT